MELRRPWQEVEEDTIETLERLAERFADRVDEVEATYGLER